MMPTDHRPARLLAPLLLLAAVAGCGARGNGGGTPVLDATAPADTGTPADTNTPIDTSTPPVDAGKPPVDVTMSPNDDGTAPADVGTVPIDTGTAPTDTGNEPEDAGTPPVDVGTPPPDVLGGYVRTTTTATQVEACTLPGVQRVLVNADDESTTLATPFDLRFFGTTVPQASGLHVYSNGFISQGLHDPTMTFFGTIPATTVPNGVIAPYWVDLITGPEGVCSVVVGTAPSRRWIVQWKNAQFYSGVTDVGPVGTASFEVIYNESDASFDFIYETLSGLPTTAPSRAAVGLENSDGTRGSVVCAGGRVDTTPPAVACTAVTTGTRFRLAPTGG